MQAIRHLRSGLDGLRGQRKRDTRCDSPPPAAPEAPPRTVTVTSRGRAHVLEVLESESVSQLNARVASAAGVPVDEVSLVARGKRLADAAQTVGAALGASNKLMLVRQRPSAATTISVSLRSPNNGRFVAGFPAPLKAPISEVAAVAARALKLPDGRSYHCYVKEGDQLLREDLSLADYHLGAGTELYVVGMELYVGAEAGMEAVRAPAPPAADAPEQREVRLPSSIAETQVPARSAEPQAQAPAASAAATNAPDAIRTGLGSAAALPPSPAKIQAAVDTALRAITSDLASDDEAMRSLLSTATAALDATAALLPAGGGALRVELPDLPEASFVLPMPAGGGPPPDLMRQLFGEGGRAMESEDESARRVEQACSQMVSSLAPAADPSRDAAKQAPTAAERRREASSWGKGLSKGFLNAKPKKKRVRKAPSPTPPDEAAAPADEAARAAAPTKRASSALRCETCATRLPITACLHAKCRCGLTFCASHLHEHRCSFDYKATEKERIRRAMPICMPSKLG